MDEAIKFVKENGWELAQRDVGAFSGGFIKREDFLEHYGFDILDDLKTLVEAWGLVELSKGVDKSLHSPALKQAINLVEQVND